MWDFSPVADVQTRVSPPPNTTAGLLPPAFHLGQSTLTPKTSGAPVSSGTQEEEEYVPRMKDQLSSCLCEIIKNILENLGAKWSRVGCAGPLHRLWLTPAEWFHKAYKSV